MRLIGAGNFCDAGGCVSVEALPAMVPPESSVSILVSYSAGRPGNHTTEVPVYTNAPSTPRLILQINANILPFDAGASRNAHEL